MKKTIQSALTGMALALLLVAGIITASSIASGSAKAQSQERKIVPSGTAFLYMGEGQYPSRELVVWLSSVSDSYTNLKSLCQAGTGLAQASQSLRDNGFRLVQSDGLLLRFEAP